MAVPPFIPGVSATRRWTAEVFAVDLRTRDSGAGLEVWTGNSGDFAWRNQTPTVQRLVEVLNH